MATSQQLPSDLAAFLTARRELAYDAQRVEPGRITLKPIETLRTTHASVDSEGHPQGNLDPHFGERGHYAVPIVSLVASCESYDPDGLLAWLPDQREYGNWDVDHWTLIAFGSTRWTDIVNRPEPYLNAQWAPAPLGYMLAPWRLGYPFSSKAPS
jgi:hypothetical protein